MSEAGFHNGRVSVQAKCSPDLKAWFLDYCRRHGDKSISDGIVDLMLEARKFDEFEQATSKTAAQDDWEMQVTLARENDGLL